MLFNLRLVPADEAPVFCVLQMNSQEGFSLDTRGPRADASAGGGFDRKNWETQRHVQGREHFFPNQVETQHGHSSLQRSVTLSAGGQWKESIAPDTIM